MISPYYVLPDYCECIKIMPPRSAANGRHAICPPVRGLDEWGLGYCAPLCTVYTHCSPYEFADILVHQPPPRGLLLLESIVCPHFVVCKASQCPRRCTDLIWIPCIFTLIMIAPATLCDHDDLYSARYIAPRVYMLSVLFFSFCVVAAS